MIDFDAALNEGKAPEVVPEVVAASLPKIDRVRKLFLPYAAEYDRMRAEAQALIITNRDQEIHATDFLLQVQELLKRIEAKRKEFVEEPNQWVRDVNNLCKLWTEPLKLMEIDIKRVLGAYMNQVRIESMKKQEEQKKALETMRKVEEQKAQDAGVPLPPATPMPIPVESQKSKTIARGTSGSASLRDNWVYEITDESLIERRFLMVNDKAIKAQIDAGMREAPGIRIYNDPKVVGRR